MGAAITKLPHVIVQSLKAGVFVSFFFRFEWDLSDRQRGLMVRTPDFPSSSPALTNRFNYSAELVQRQLVCFLSFGILNLFSSLLYSVANCIVGSQQPIAANYQPTYQTYYYYYYY